MVLESYVFRINTDMIGHASDVRLVAFDLDAGGAGVRFWQNEGHQRGGDDDKQKDRQNNRFPNSDDAPVIEEV